MNELYVLNLAPPFDNRIYNAPHYQPTSNYRSYSIFLSYTIYHFEK